MTNTIVTPDTIARMALATLYNTSRMLPLVSRDFDADFTGQVGDTVNVRKPATFTASKFVQAVGRSLQNMTEDTVPVVLDTIWDVSIPFTSKELTLDLPDLQARVIAPALEAISQAVDTQLLSLRDDVTASITASKYNASTNPHPTFDLINAGRVLTTAKVPLDNRVAVVDEYIGSQWRMDELSNRADARGDAGTGLRDAAIGRMHGFDSYESNNIDDYTGMAFHPTAFSFVTRPLAVLPGMVNASVQSYKGLSVRISWDYDGTYKQTVLSLDFLCGVKTMDATRAVLINGLNDSV